MRVHDFTAFGIRSFAALATAAALCGPVSGFAATCSARSGPETTALVELYTSEGCNSCPPADRWLMSSFKPGATGAKSAALAFHVDYWDRLGWKDRFASAAYTERQYDVTRTGGARFAYTPQVVIQGKDYSNWRGAGVPAALAAINARPARASITVDAAAQPGAIAVHAVAGVPSSADRKDAVLLLALTENSLVSDVKAGENAGVRLTHDHVVRAFRAGPAVGAAGAAEFNAVLPLPAEAGTAPTVVAFVQNTRTGEVLQALPLPLEAACMASR
jgi:hypothetical protein